MFKLRDYQEDIAEKAKALLDQHHFAYLVMQVRTGKTLTALRAAQLHGAKSVLFLTKKKAVESIQSDYNQLAPDFILTITNYEQAHKLEPVYDLIIADEMHCLGQFPMPAQKVKTLKKLCEGRDIIGLSGTPSPESMSQLYHQFFISSWSPFSQYKNFYSWAKDYVVLKKKYFFNRQINDYSGAIKSKIDEATSHLFISFTQEEAGFTSPVHEHLVFVPMKPSTYQLAALLKRDRIYITKAGNEILGDTAVKLMGKLHQIYSGTVLSEDGTMTAFDDSKIVYLKERFKDKKIAIFYKYRAELSLIEKHFKNITVSPEDFNHRSDKVFVSQIQSGREGINLSTADCLCMINIDFSFVSYYQARARLQTKDRTKQADVYWIFAEGGIEQKIYERVQGKKNFTASYFTKEYKLRFEQEAA